MMKTKNIFKTLAFAMLMSAILLSSACSNINDNEDTNKKGYTLPVTVNVTRQSEDPATKATYNESTKKLSFSEGDKLFVNGKHTSAGVFAGTLNWTSGETFNGTIFTQNEYSGTTDALFNISAQATLLPAGYDDYKYFSIAGKGYNAVLNRNLDKAFVSTTSALVKKVAVEQLCYEHAGSYAQTFGFLLSSQNAILNFTIGGLTANADNISVSLTSPSGFTAVTGSVTADGNGVATFAVGVGGNTDLKNLSLTVGEKSVSLTSDSKTLAGGHVYNITRSVGPSLADAFVANNTTEIKFEGLLTLSAKYVGNTFGTVSIGGSMKSFYSDASMERDGNNLVIHVENSVDGVGNMTINTDNYTYSWDNDAFYNRIRLSDITIGGHSIKPLPTKK